MPWLSGIISKPGTGEDADLFVLNYQQMRKISGDYHHAAINPTIVDQIILII